MGRHEEAIAELRRAVELDPVSVMYLTNLGWVYYMAHRYDSAIEYLQRSLELEPGAVDGDRGLGEIYVQKGMYDEAIAHMQKYVELTDGYRLRVGLPWIRLRHGRPARQSNGNSRDVAGSSKTAICARRTPLRRSMSVLATTTKRSTHCGGTLRSAPTPDCFGSRSFRCSIPCIPTQVHRPSAQDRRRARMIGQAALVCAFALVRTTFAAPRDVGVESSP